MVALLTGSLVERWQRGPLPAVLGLLAAPALIITAAVLALTLHPAAAEAQLAASAPTHASSPAPALQDEFLFVFLIDVTGSMTGHDARGVNVWPLVTSELAAIIRHLPLPSEVMILPFADGLASPVLYQHLSTQHDLESVLQFTSELRAEGSRTAFFDSLCCLWGIAGPTCADVSIRATVERFWQARREGKAAVVYLLTDGRDNASSATLDSVASICPSLKNRDNYLFFIDLQGDLTPGERSRWESCGTEVVQTTACEPGRPCQVRIPRMLFLRPTVIDFGNFFAADTSERTVVMTIAGTPVDDLSVSFSVALEERLNQAGIAPELSTSNTSSSHVVLFPPGKDEMQAQLRLRLLNFTPPGAAPPGRGAALPSALLGEELHGKLLLTTNDDLVVPVPRELPIRMAIREPATVSFELAAGETGSIGPVTLDPGEDLLDRLRRRLVLRWSLAARERCGGENKARVRWSPAIEGPAQRLTLNRQVTASAQLADGQVVPLELDAASLQAPVPCDSALVNLTIDPGGRHGVQRGELYEGKWVLEGSGDLAVEPAGGSPPAGMEPISEHGRHGFALPVAFTPKWVTATTWVVGVVAALGFAALGFWIFGRKTGGRLEGYIVCAADGQAISLAERSRLYGRPVLLGGRGGVCVEVGGLDQPVASLSPMEGPALLATPLRELVHCGERRGAGEQFVWKPGDEVVIDGSRFRYEV